MTEDEEMRKALEADGEKLRQLTGKDHGPFQERDYASELALCERYKTSNTILPQELAVLRDTVAYLRSFAQQYPDAPGDSFAAKMRSHSQVIEELVERFEAQP